MSETIKPQSSIGGGLEDGAYLLEITSLQCKNKNKDGGEFPSGVWGLQLGFTVADSTDNPETVGFKHTEYFYLNPDFKSKVNFAFGLLINAGIVPQDVVERLPLTALDDQALRDKLEKKAPGCKIGVTIVRKDNNSDIKEHFAESVYRSNASSSGSNGESAPAADTGSDW
jgi:hypothetical protein